MKRLLEEARHDETARFKVLTCGPFCGSIRVGDIVKIYDDDCPLFITKDGRLGCLDYHAKSVEEIEKECLEVINEESPTIIDIAKTLDACELHEALSENFERLSIIDLRAAVVGLARLLEEKDQQLSILREDINDVREPLK